MQASRQIRYSVAFKRQVVAELESGRFRSIEQARTHYGIGGMGTIRQWLKRLGKNHLMPKVVRVERPDEADQVRQLKQEIIQLREALGQTQMHNILNESRLEIACERLGVDVEAFKKNTARSGPPIPRAVRIVGDRLVPGCGYDTTELL